jgi:hypothetical protein
VSLTLPALLALAVPAALEAQITVSPEFVRGSTPGRWIFTGTYNVPASCGGDTFTFLQGRDPSGKPIGTTSFVSATPAAATAVTPGTSGGFLAEFRTGIPDQEKVVADFDIPAGTTQAVFAVGISGGGSPTCSNPSLSFPVPIAPGPNLAITKSVHGAFQLLNGGTTYFNDILVFHIDVTNVGSGPTTAGVTITDRLSPLLRGGILSGPCSYNAAGDLVTCNVPSIAPGQTVTVLIPATVVSQAESAFSNTATVTGGGDPATPKSSAVTLNNRRGSSPFLCAAGDANLCLFADRGSLTTPGPTSLAASASGRFQVRVYWDAVRQGTSGPGHAVALTSDTGYFWFFSPNNVELVIKVVDGRPVNGKFWVFYGALSNVEYVIEIVDSITGAVQGYFNPQDTQASNADTSSLGSATTVGAESEFQFSPMNASDPAADRPTASVPEPVETAVSAACVADALTQCLNGGRFQVRVHWDALHQGTSGEGQAVPITSDTGYFWFFSANNIELVIKVVDGRPVNGKFWVFYGALTNVQYTITITDTVTGAVKSYFNPQDTQASASDTSAF